MEPFILLHEYGHISLGHLASNRLRPALGGKVPRLNGYDKTWQEEFEADRYAVEGIASHGTRSGLRPPDVAFGAGLVLKFFELSEGVAQEH